MRRGVENAAEQPVAFRSQYPATCGRVVLFVGVIEGCRY